MRVFDVDLLCWAFNVSTVDVVYDIVGSASVNGTSDRLGGSQDLLHDARQLFGLGPRLHNLGGVDDVVHGDVAVVLNVLDLKQSNDPLNSEFLSYLGL